MSDWHGGVPWAPSVLRRAIELGVAEEVSALALRHRTQSGSYYTTPHVHPLGGTRVHDGSVTAILSEWGIVVGFYNRSPEQIEQAQVEQAAIRADVARAGAGGIARSRGGAGNLNPTSFEELVTMLQSAGLVVEYGGKHLSVSTTDGERVSTLAISASDGRSLMNTVTQLRKATGLPLRRG